MAIILKHGNTYKTTTCEHCNAKIGYTNKDIIWLGTMDVNWNTIYIDAIRCPECGQKTEVNELSNLIARGLNPSEIKEFFNDNVRKEINEKRD